jgi:thiamine biosynthesis lipoprotein
VEITVQARDTKHCDTGLEQAFAAILHVQREMSFHDAGSTLSCINATAFTTPVTVEAKTFRVLRTARLLYSLSNGLFDPTIASHLQRAGFLPLSPGQTLTNCSFDDVEFLHQKRIRFRQAGVRLDLGGIAKGFAVDEAVSALRRAGITSGLVNAGGDLRAFGSQSFVVGIRDAQNPGKKSASFAIKNIALATSGHYFAERLMPGPDIGPFVDPRIGKLSGELASVTVAARTALVADALTKVVMLDPENSLPVLRRFAAESLVQTENGAILSTRNWHERLQTTA